MKNKLKTCGYFKKRLRDNGFIILDVFKNFDNNDKRRWSILINPGKESIFCTCYGKYDNDFDTVFEFNDGGNNIPTNFKLYTPSMEVIIEQLIVSWGVNNDNKLSPDYKKKNEHETR